MRISAVTEQSLKLDTCPNDTSIDATLVFYGVLSPLCPPPNPYPIPGLNDRAAGAQVLEVTALAVLPNGSEKLVQYLVAPIALPPFSATLTMAGQTANSVAFSAPQSNANYRINGGDQDAVGSCVPGPPVDAIGVFNGVDEGNVINGGNGGTGIPAADRPNYTGSNAAPDVNVIASIPPTLQTPAQLEALVQGIIQVADVVIPGPATGASLPSSMYSPNPNPMTVVVNGDLDLNGWKHTGYGLLLVRGHLNYDPDASWDGIVMVVGQGIVTGTKGGTGVFDGALLIAKTLDAGGNLLSPNFGLATMLYGTNMGGRGMRYSSCWIQASQPGIRILSFHEISQ